MHGHYLGQVGRHKPCVPVVFVKILIPVWDRFATTVAVGAFGRHGATQDLAQRGVGWSGRDSVMAVGLFCWNALVHPNGSARPCVPWCGESALSLQSVLIYR